MRQTTFGGRYVSADDVARCMEAFRSCTSGGDSRGGDKVPPTGTSGGDHGKKGLPQHFVIKATGDVDVDYDCRLNGDSASCTQTLRSSFDGLDSWSAGFAGKRAGLIVTGSVTGQQKAQAPADPSCGFEQNFVGPARYVFSLDGTVTLSEGPFQTQEMGNCKNSSSDTTDAVESTGTWSPTN